MGLVEAWGSGIKRILNEAEDSDKFMLKLEK